MTNGLQNKMDSTPQATTCTAHAQSDHGPLHQGKCSPTEQTAAAVNGRRDFLVIYTDFMDFVPTLVNVVIQWRFSSHCKM